MQGERSHDDNHEGRELDRATHNRCGRFPKATTHFFAALFCWMAAMSRRASSIWDFMSSSRRALSMVMLPMISERQRGLATIVASEQMSGIDVKRCLTIAAVTSQLWGGAREPFERHCHTRQE